MSSTTNTKRLINLFLENPDRMRMGKGKLSKRYKCSPEEIVEARFMAKEK